MRWLFLLIIGNPKTRISVKLKVITFIRNFTKICQTVNIDVHKHRSTFNNYFLRILFLILTFKDRASYI